MLRVYRFRLEPHAAAFITTDGLGHDPKPQFHKFDIVASDLP